MLASPYGVLERSGDPVRDRSRLKAIVEETGARLVLVGLPLSLSGRPGAAAAAALAEADALAQVCGVPVRTFDERLTTVEAARRRRERGSPRRRPKGAGAREGIDAEAAAVLLGAFLDAGRGSP